MKLPADTDTGNINIVVSFHWVQQSISSEAASGLFFNQNGTESWLVSLKTPGLQVCGAKMAAVTSVLADAQTQF